MSLTPEEIRSKDFLVAVRGYDKEEVEAFLGSVAEEFAAMRERLADAWADGQGGPSPGPDPFAGLGDQVASIMRTAADGAAQVRSDSDREAAAVRAAALRESAQVTEAAQAELEAANELRAEAEQQAAQVRAAAREEASRIREEARLELEHAREARAAAARQATELGASTARRQEALVADAEARLAAMLSAAEQEIDWAVAEILRGCERLRGVQGRALVLPIDPVSDAAGDDQREADANSFAERRSTVGEAPAP